MEYNWADPKKNTKLSSLLMSKAEASRKKRLTSVRSTLSNQLHPSIENKLRKRTKKAPASARRDAGKEEDDEEEEDQQGDNNDAHHALNECQNPHEPRKSGKSLGAFQSRPQQHQRPESDHEPSMFDAFDLNAAADGLFHPASTISAFIEHDAKYNSVSRNGQTDAKEGLKRGKSNRKTTPKGDSREGPTAGNSDKLLHGSASRLKELPALSDRGSASSLRLLHTRGSSRSSSASSFASPSSGSRESTATRSDSDLLMLAPRRLGAIPSSADRSALDFYEHDGDENEQDGEQDQHVSERRQTTEDDDGLDHAPSASLGGGAFDLTTKFAALKMFHQNQASRSSCGNGDQPPRGHDDEVDEAGNGTGVTPASITAKSHTASRGLTVSIRGSKHGHSSRIAGGKANAATSTKTIDSTSFSSIAGHSRSTKPSAPSRREANTVAIAATSENTEAIYDCGATDKKPKKEGKAHSGMSLTDLKEEHRAALELLKELGGPADTEFRDEDMNRSISLLAAARSGKAISVVGGGASAAGRLGVGRGVAAHATTAKVPMNSHSISKTGPPPSQQHTVMAAHRFDQQQQRQFEPENGGESSSESLLRPLSSSSSGSLVSKLRSSVALGRVVSQEEATDDGEDDNEGEEDRDSEEEDDKPSLSSVVGGVDSSPHESDITDHNNEQREHRETPWSATTANLKAVNGDGEAQEQGMAASSGDEPGSTAELQWEQYCANFDDMGAAEEEGEEDDEASASEQKRATIGENDQDGDAVATARGYTPVSSRSVDNRYSDEGFEADW